MIKWIWLKIKKIYDSEYNYENEFEISIYEILAIIILIFLLVKIWI